MFDSTTLAFKNSNQALTGISTFSLNALGNNGHEGVLLSPHISRTGSSLDTTFGRELLTVCRQYCQSILSVANGCLAERLLF